MFAEIALQFVKTPPKGTLQHIRKNKEIIFYNKESNTFIVTTSAGIPKTMMKPVSCSHGKFLCSIHPPTKTKMMSVHKNN